MHSGETTFATNEHVSLTILVDNPEHAIRSDVHTIALFYKYRTYDEEIFCQEVRPRRRHGNLFSEPLRQAVQVGDTTRKTLKRDRVLNKKSGAGFRIESLPCEVLL